MICGVEKEVRKPVHLTSSRANLIYLYRDTHGRRVARVQAPRKSSDNARANAHIYAYVYVLVCVTIPSAAFLTWEYETKYILYYIHALRETGFVHRHTAALHFSTVLLRPRPRSNQLREREHFYAGTPHYFFCL